MQESQLGQTGSRREGLVERTVPTRRGGGMKEGLVERKVSMGGHQSNEGGELGLK